MMSRRVLIIVHDFPPMGGGSVMRVAKFVKYLPSFGWEPIVLTLQDVYYPARLFDASLYDELPRGLRTYRTKSLKVRDSVKSSLKQQARRSNHSLGRLAIVANKWLYDHLLVHQDEGYLWYPYSIPAVCRIVKAEQIDAILTTSPPHNVHWLGVLAKRIAHKPWVADFRDGWTDDKLFQSRLAWRNSLERWQEHQVIKQADRVISVTERIDGWFSQRYGAEYKNKSLLITNGFDPADFSMSRCAEADRSRLGELTIAHVGSIHGSRHVEPFLNALKRLLETSDIPHGQIRVEFVGDMDEHQRRLAVSVPGVTVTPHISHPEAVQKMRQAHVLLLVNYVDSQEALTGKLFEYIAAQRPILALTGPGLLQRLIESEKLGMVAPPDDVAAIESALRTLYKLGRANELSQFGPRQALLATYNRSNLTQRLALALDDLVSPPVI